MAGQWLRLVPNLARRIKCLQRFSAYENGQKNWPEKTLARRRSIGMR